MFCLAFVLLVDPGVALLGLGGRSAARSAAYGPSVRRFFGGDSTSADSVASFLDGLCEDTFVEEPFPDSEFSKLWNFRFVAYMVDAPKVDVASEGMCSSEYAQCSPELQLEFNNIIDRQPNQAPTR